MLHSWACLLTRWALLCFFWNVLLTISCLWTLEWYKVSFNFEGASLYSLEAHPFLSSWYHFPEVFATPVKAEGRRVYVYACTLFTLLLIFFFWMWAFSYYFFFQIVDLFCEFLKWFLLIKSEYWYRWMGSHYSYSGDVASKRCPAERRRPACARDVHLTDTVKQGQFRENDLNNLT